MEDTAIMTGPSDMLSGTDSSFFSDPAATEIANGAAAEEAAGEATPGVDDTQIEEPVSDEPGDVAEPADEAEQPAEEEQPVEQAAKPEEKPGEELPDGVRRGKDRNGKEGLWVEPKRWDSIYGDHKLVRQAADRLGEPLTLDAIDLRNRALAGQERLYGDLLSGEPQAQTKLLNHFFDEAAQAVEQGMIGQDPTLSLAKSFYNVVKERSPDGYAEIRQESAKELIAEMYQLAAQNQDPNLYHSAGHIAKALSQPYHTRDEMDQMFAGKGAPDPVQTLRQENEALKAQLNGRSTDNRAAQFDTWATQQRKQTTDAVLNEVLQPTLEASQQEWSKIEGGKEAFSDLVTARLQSAIVKATQEDSAFQERISRLSQNAARATSAQARNAIGEQIKQAYMNKAKLVVEAKRRDIETFAARKFKETSDATHQRRAAAQRQRGPGGTAAPVPKSLIPPPAPKSDSGGFFNPANEARDAARLISSLR